MRRSERHGKITTRSRAAKKEGKSLKPKAVPNKPKAGKPRMLKRSQGKTNGSKNKRVRVWWPPSENKKRTGYSGMYWPATVLNEDEDEDTVRLEYDNGDIETVSTENLQPSNPPVDFGEESKPLQVGEFVEIFNNSTTDPAAWVGLLTKIDKKGYTVTYPFHDTEDEVVKESLLRRARVWETHTSKWLFVQPFQEWEDGEVTSPVELCLCTEKELFAYLAKLRKKLGEVDPGPSHEQGQLESSISRTAHEADGRMAASQASAPGPSYQQSAEAAAVRLGAPQQQAFIEGGRIPPEWVPAPNLGPSSYIVPSRNPVSAPVADSASAADEAPYVVRVSDPAQPAPGGVAESLSAAAGGAGGGGAAKKKKKRDPNAPRKPLSAYILYINSRREQVKEVLGPQATAQEVTRKLAEMWAHISAQERELLQEEVDRERARYEEAMRNYVPQPGWDESEDEELPRKRAKKDKDAPKRPRTAYILFSTEYRKGVDALVDFKAATHMAAEAWKAADAETKAHYEALASNEKDAYEAALKVYKRHKEEHSSWGAAQPPERRGSHDAASLQAGPRPAEASAAQAPLRPIQPSVPALVAGHPADILERLNLETAKKALNKEKFLPEAYYMLADVWRHDSPRLDAAVRAFRMHVDGHKRPDYKAFMIGIFGLETMRQYLKPAEES